MGTGHQSGLSYGIFYCCRLSAASDRSHGWGRGYRYSFGIVLCRIGGPIDHLLLLLATGDPVAAF